MAINIALILAACAKSDTPQNTEDEVDYETLENLTSSGEMKNPYDTLNVATYITKIDGTYFIADCYHDQIIYNDNLEDDIGKWKVLTNEVHYAHTIASDGISIVIDDTENNRLLVFQKIAGEYVHTQTFEDIGMKPHYVQYDEKTGLFYAWSSITGEMYMLKRSQNATGDGVYPLYIDKVYKIDELYGVYVRSFTIMEDGIYFVSGHNNEKILKAVVDNDNDCFEIVGEYKVSPSIAGMVQISRIGEYYYITVSTDNEENQDYATIIRTDSLEKLEVGDYEDIYQSFGISGGTPYYITKIEGRYYMTHHRTEENIIAFDIIDNNIENIQVLY
jgi:hypothetical protein